MIVGMVTPVSLALVFNIMCLTKNIHAIRHLQQVSTITESSEARLVSNYKMDGFALQNCATLTGRMSSAFAACEGFSSFSKDVLRRDMMARNLSTSKSRIRKTVILFYFERSSQSHVKD